MSSIESQGPSNGQKLYFAAWRWHFYAGLFVVPFLLMLALTGAFMMVYDVEGNEMGYTPDIVATGPALAPSTIAKAALAAVPEGTVITYVTAAGPTRPTYVEIAKGDAYIAVAVNQYTGQVIVQNDESQTWRVWAEKLHGTLLLGTFGDRLVEAAASLAILLVVTGLYLWWPRGTGVLAALVPNLTAKGRGLVEGTAQGNRRVDFAGAGGVHPVGPGLGRDLGRRLCQTLVRLSGAEMGQCPPVRPDPCRPEPHRPA